MATVAQTQVINLLAHDLIKSSRLRKEVVRRATGNNRGRKSQAWKDFDERLYQLSLSMKKPQQEVIAIVIEAAIIRVPIAF